MFKKIILSSILVLTLAACTDPNGATEALQDAGYSNIEITGYNMLSCSEDDEVHTGFTATGPTGRQVRGTVCSGLIGKDQTIRLKR